jgi:hypothetical protein
MHLNKLCLLTLLMACANAAQAAATHVDLELAIRHDNNLSRAESGRDILSDNVLDLGITATQSILLTPYSGLRIKGGLHLAQHAEYTDLDQLSANAGFSYRIQPVAGYTAPWMELGASLERKNHRNSNIRDGEVLAAEAMVGKRFTDRIGGRIGIGWEKRWADEAEVFEWNRHRIFALADYRAGLDTTIYASVSRDFGDQVFTATPAPSFRTVARAIADDPAFGARRAYRLDAVSTTLELGVSMPVNASNVLDFGARHFRAEADGSHTYNDTELRASWLYRFR